MPQTLKLLLFSFLIILSSATFAQEEGDSILVGTTRTKTTITKTTKTTSSNSSSSNSSSSSFSTNLVKVTGDSSTRRFNVGIEDLNGPIISLISPQAKEGQHLSELNKLVTILGKVEDEGEIEYVNVNSKPTELSEDGQFWITVELNYGKTI